MARVYKISESPRRTSNIFGSFSLNTNIIFINLAVFIFVTILLAKNVFPIDYVALKPANVFEGKYLWTFLTSMFMHGSFFHIFANMVSLFFIGGLVQKILGPKRYLWFYILSGLFAGLLFVLLSLVSSSDFNAYAVGASGALFGLVGFLVVITPNLPVYVMFIPIPIKMKYAGPGILFVLWLISIGADVGIGNTAHLGGLIAGLGYGIYLKNKYKNKTRMISRHFS